MNASSPTLRRLAGAFAALAAAAALAAPTALADPPNYQRELPQAQRTITHVPEIVAGLAAAPEGRPAPRPEVISGIVPSGRQVLASSLVRQSPAAHTGFSWNDAGIGAAIALAVVALASACALALRKRISLAH